MSDLRYALRSLARSPGFASVAILSLALGIGANAPIYSVIRAVLLDPLPVAAPEMTIIALMAGFFPARRAACLDPLTALRYE